ncbi:unnamed protein product [Rotaria sp. Silwood1]|nr:unnamed protein product [Rotaria sp. Silwood1]CAF1133906.1 unnamed protein product [Rotaria sp. Silwood1]CAF3450985.1 unnamed protein product [Rotaria sp. Silwood1]CAF3484258.1 unnamed protein product [Rotaria sp. Silwood1]CAF4632882.1 unnamed protein product [Rotaria sp. Silwood1]
MSTNKFSNFCLFLFVFFLSTQLTSTLVCFECNNCDNIISCTCNNTVSVDVKASYCILLRESLPNAVDIEIKHISRNSTTYYIYDPYYISVQETISYDGTMRRWHSKSNKITYACQTDGCNRPDLIKQLPATGLSLMLPSDWLDENLQRKPDKITTLCRDCEGESICDDTTDLVNINKCTIKECQGSCFMGEAYEIAETTQFCHESFCSDDTSIGPIIQLPEIGITAVYYINKKQLEVVEIDVKCNADNCSRLEIFKDIKDKLQKNLNGIQPFLPPEPTVTSEPTVTREPTKTSSPTQPTNHSNAIYLTSIIFLMMIFLQTLIFY